VNLSYQTLERLSIRRPVDRLSWLAKSCAGKVVLDIGCYDETALAKRDTHHWLHGRLAKTAKRVVGVDSSSKIPHGGLRTASNAAIHRGDGVHVDAGVMGGDRFDVVVAGEFIEHIESPLDFLRDIKARMPGAQLLISTPNGVCFANTLLGLIRREVQHPDHLQNFTFKILNTLCVRAEFTQWEILPYRFYATEMILGSTGIKRALVIGVEQFIRVVEWFFPLLSFGYIIKVKI
jgi:2-polyprenyl-3-methyl-5-hydroxy-6-metoxy-1,4-benzoquinol methylase